MSTLNLHMHPHTCKNAYTHTLHTQAKKNFRKVFWARFSRGMEQMEGTYYKREIRRAYMLEAGRSSHGFLRAAEAENTGAAQSTTLDTSAVSSQSRKPGSSLESC